VDLLPFFAQTALSQANIHTYTYTGRATTKQTPLIPASWAAAGTAPPVGPRPAPAATPHTHSSASSAGFSHSNAASEPPNLTIRTPAAATATAATATERRLTRVVYGRCQYSRQHHQQSVSGAVRVRVRTRVCVRVRSPCPFSVSPSSSSACCMRQDVLAPGVGLCLSAALLLEPDGQPPCCWSCSADAGNGRAVESGNGADPGEVATERERETARHLFRRNSHQASL
jgi:hypothetical protein